MKIKIFFLLAFTTFIFNCKENKTVTVDTILDNSSEGQVGDGKIFIYDVQDSIRIRTRTRGKEAII